MLVDKILVWKVFQPKNGDTSFKKQYVLKQKPKFVITMAIEPKMATTIATKSMSELLKEAWIAKVKVVAQAIKIVKTTKKLSKLASLTTVIFSFDDWKFKRLVEKYGKDKHFNGDSFKGMKKLNDELHSFSYEITNPTMMFIK